MSQSLAPTAVSTGARAAIARAWANPETRSVIIGVAAVIVFHLLLWLAAPFLVRFGPPAAFTPTSGTERNFNIELTPEMFAKPEEPKDPDRFVETNPEAPENTPDKTRNFAAQNQQVAQEKPTPDSKSDRPALEGKPDLESNQIVSGRLSQPVEQVETPTPTPDRTAEAEREVKAARMEQNPLSGTEKFEGDNQAGIGGNRAKRVDNMKPIPERIEGAPNATETEGQANAQPAIDPLRPRPRPMIVKQQQVRPAILAENKFGTQNVGLTAIDARWSNYGAYLQRMIDTVQIQWERLILSMSAMPAGGSTVSVKFVMNDEGKITSIKQVESSASASETAQRSCVSAITDRAPYGPWTDDMKAVLGAQQEMTFTFHYQ
jgi:hypothetical protein